jgi:hypothetical protein
MFLFTATQAPAADRVQTAIKNAAATTGADFQYLLTTAQRESALDPNAHAPNSSASGLFQFLDSTWLQTVKEAGPSYGLSSYADSITKTASGSYVADPSMRQTILDLRTDPAANATMAGAFTQMNSQYLANALGREPSAGELYVAHFMGAAGAAKLITLASNDANANAAQAFPHQAGANRSIFYAKDGAPRTAAQVYANLVGSFDASTTQTTATPQLAASGTATDSAGIIKVSQNPAAWLAVPEHNAYAIETNRPFNSLFRTDASAPISNYVAATWSNLGAVPPSVSANRPVAQKDAAVTVAPAAVRSLTQQATRSVPLPIVQPSPVKDTAAANQGVAGGIDGFFVQIFAASQAAPLREDKH